MDNSLMLSIATIGDLLLNSKLTVSEKGNALDSIELSIPEYQRPYKWTEKNAIQLLDDIIEAKTQNRERYRVGTLILHKRTNEEGVRYDIVDGQQRVVTFSLLLKALGRDVGFLNQQLSQSAYNRRNVPANYRALERRVKSIDVDQREELFAFVSGQCELIVVITEKLAEAFQFFDSQNARGKKLYPHDLLKAFHLREMRSLNAAEVETVVENWENLDQGKLSALFSEYLYCVRRWVRGNRAGEFSEHDIQMFKGVNGQNSYPYAQFYKGAYSYAHAVNTSSVPFAMGARGLSPFQLDTPIVAGRPFFEYAKHYFEILEDIQNNDKYEGYYINDNDIVKTLDAHYKHGIGNRVARHLFDTAVLLYVDRFCPERPEHSDLEMFDEFVKYAFIWAYSLRAQYVNLGWWQAQNYIMGTAVKGDRKKNSFNIYKVIIESDTPRLLLASLSERMWLLSWSDIKEGSKGKKSRNREGWRIDDCDDGVYRDYLYFFEKYGFWEANHEN